MIMDGPAPIAPHPKRHREFGERLRQARITLPMALRKFASEIGYSPTAISRVEQGEIGDTMLESVALGMCVRLSIPHAELLAAKDIQAGDLVAFDKIKNARGYPLTGEVLSISDGVAVVRTWGYVGPGAEMDIQDVPLAEIRQV